MAVLLAFFLKGYQPGEDWVHKFFLLLVILTAPLLFLRLIPKKALFLWWVQAGFFLADVGIATVILRWTGASDLYAVYFLIIFGTALSRSPTQSFFVAMTTSALFLAAAWRPLTGLPKDSVFWLKVLFLWVISALLAILSRDSQQAQSDEERRYQERLIQIERLAALGQVAGEVAHRIKGPLTTIMVNAEVLSHRFAKSKDALKELSEIRSEVLHCKEILKNLLDLGRLEEVDIRRMDLRDAVNAAVKSVQTQVDKSGLSLRVAGLSRPLPLQGDESLLLEALSAVLQNAIDAAKKNGTIQLTAKPLRSSYLIAIEDDGAGIKSSDLELIFKPFFTTKGPEGSGLGLSAALRIVQKHHGSMQAYSDGLGMGAKFTLTLPRDLPPRRD